MAIRVPIIFWRFLYALYYDYIMSVLNVEIFCFHLLYYFYKSNQNISCLEICICIKGEFKKVNCVDEWDMYRGRHVYVLLPLAPSVERRVGGKKRFTEINLETYFSAEHVSPSENEHGVRAPFIFLHSYIAIRDKWNSPSLCIPLSPFRCMHLL